MPNYDWLKDYFKRDPRGNPAANKTLAQLKALAQNKVRPGRGGGSS